MFSCALFAKKSRRLNYATRISRSRLDVVVNLALEDPEVLPGRRDLRDLRDLPDHRGLLVLQAILDLKDLKAPRAPLEVKGLPAHLDHQAQKDRLDLIMALLEKMVAPEEPYPVNKPYSADGNGLPIPQLRKDSKPEGRSSRYRTGRGLRDLDQTGPATHDVQQSLLAAPA